MPRKSEASSMDDQTRRSKRKASPASKSPPRNTSEKNVNQRVKRKDIEDAEESSQTKKRAFEITDLTQNDDEVASSSEDTGREKYNSMPRESEASSMDDQTRRSKRKASPASEKAQRKRTRMSKSPPRNTSEKNVNQGVKRKDREDGEESSKSKKRAFEIIDITQDDDELASSSVDNGREGTTGVGTSAPVSLLDWYDLGHELILVLERPVPSTDLFQYIRDNGGSIEEDEAKIIVKQLVDAAKELEDKRIFHRDIKVENILIETGSGTPRLRLIDFGLSSFIKEDPCYYIFYGTPDHVTPEWLSRNTYYAGPTTVWQVGVVLYELVHRNTYFVTQNFTSNEQMMRDDLSEGILQPVMADGCPPWRRFCSRFFRARWTAQRTGARERGGWPTILPAAAVGASAIVLITSGDRLVARDRRIGLF
ncbi:Serine/threonine-protein kinase pim-2 [Nibea albiflora]|uniref:Serine/threonine-protein kinase pim-2 n=1 Tax=Nibea albiflora TaxID=240163 RepID=A0ACB7F315_NIBAL|nr:Serine/threonine-protein kinase pim-2 [Nibea albiflora]